MGGQGSSPVPLRRHAREYGRLIIGRSGVRFVKKEDRFGVILFRAELQIGEHRASGRAASTADFPLALQVEFESMLNLRRLVRAVMQSRLALGRPVRARNGLRSRPAS